MTIKAIETRYAGCRFRSRLEARWAIFFDTLDITWEYEPQGFELPWRLDYHTGTIPYLPDFWLPRLDVWAEVKGELRTSDAIDRLLNCAAALSAPDGGCGHRDLVVLPPIPPTSLGYPLGYPLRLHMHKGDLEMSPWLATDRHSGCEVTVGTDLGLADPLVAKRWRVAEDLIGAIRRGPWIDGDGQPATQDDHQRYLDALAAARSARFEHGETPVVAR